MWAVPHSALCCLGVLPHTSCKQARMRDVNGVPASHRFTGSMALCFLHALSSQAPALASTTPGCPSLGSSLISQHNLTRMLSVFQFQQTVPIEQSRTTGTHAPHHRPERQCQRATDATSAEVRRMMDGSISEFTPFRVTARPPPGARTLTLGPFLHWSRHLHDVTLISPLCASAACLAASNSSRAPRWTHALP